jgi:hypothetical protein
MILKMMAITPSLNASMRPVLGLSRRVVHGPDTMVDGRRFLRIRF